VLVISESAATPPVSCTASFSFFVLGPYGLLLGSLHSLGNTCPLINMTLTFLRTNDLHLNARNYEIDSQTPENALHFAMRICPCFHHCFSDGL